MDRQFYNSNGDLTAYSFACGYIQKVDTHTLHKQMFMEHGHYHVQSTINNSPALHGSFNNASHKFTIWEVFSNGELTKARKFYNSIK